MQTCQLKSLQNAKKTIDKFTKCNYYIIKVCDLQTTKEVNKMFKNLDAEQARAGMTNLNVAEKLGISRVSYENKKKTGKFTTLEIKCLCKLFSCKFDYLFATEER